jgi:DNA adenine methylase
LKWAGGKRQLIPQIDRFFPPELKEGSIRRYVEPFIGSGAVFFHVAQNYGPAQLVIADANHELIMAYRSIQRCVEDVIARLAEVEHYYLPLAEKERKRHFYEQRAAFNDARLRFVEVPDCWTDPERTAQLIFLNRTCYNGLFRVNSKGAFNVPFGRYKNPRICDAANLRAVSRLLQDTAIHNGPYHDCASLVDHQTLVYFDPPYRPISKTANFTAYSQQMFDDEAQIELAGFYRRLHERDARLMLSNSDPQNVDPDDRFFENIYHGFRLERIRASRRINSKAGSRGPVYELLILNY